MLIHISALILKLRYLNRKLNSSYIYFTSQTHDSAKVNAPPKERWTCSGVMELPVATANQVANSTVASIWPNECLCLPTRSGCLVKLCNTITQPIAFRRKWTHSTSRHLSALSRATAACTSLLPSSDACKLPTASTIDLQSYMRRTLRQSSFPSSDEMAFSIPVYLRLKGATVDACRDSGLSCFGPFLDFKIFVLTEIPYSRRIWSPIFVNLKMVFPLNSDLTQF